MVAFEFDILQGYHLARPLIENDLSSPPSWIRRSPFIVTRSLRHRRPLVHRSVTLSPHPPAVPIR